MKKQRNQELPHAAFAGIVAITINTILLKAAILLNIKAESGGLLKLLLQYPPEGIKQLPFVHGTLFWIIFHYLTGMGMVLLYAYLLKPLLPGKGWIKGSLFSLFPWFINGFIVLPLLGQGLLGYQALSISGILYFFIANWAFGLLVGILDEKKFISYGYWA
jgi:hypothetical protein